MSFLPCTSSHRNNCIAKYYKQLPLHFEQRKALEENRKARHCVLPQQGNNDSTNIIKGKAEKMLFIRYALYVPILGN